MEPSDNLSVGVRPERRAGPRPTRLECPVSAPLRPPALRIHQRRARLPAATIVRRQNPPSEPLCCQPQFMVLGCGASPERARRRVSPLFKCCACCVRSALFRPAPSRQHQVGGGGLGYVYATGHRPHYRLKRRKSTTSTVDPLAATATFSRPVCRSAPRQCVQGSSYAPRCARGHADCDPATRKRHKYAWAADSPSRQACGRRLPGLGVRMCPGLGACPGVGRAPLSSRGRDSSARVVLPEPLCGQLRLQQHADPDEPFPAVGGSLALRAIDQPGFKVPSYGRVMGSPHGSDATRPL